MTECQSTFPKWATQVAAIADFFFAAQPMQWTPSESFQEVVMWVAIASIYSLGMLLVAGGVLLRRAERAQAREAHRRADLIHVNAHVEEVLNVWRESERMPRTALTTTERGVTCH